MNSAKAHEPVRNLLNVVFATDEKYITHFATALTSLLETNLNIVGRVFVVSGAINSPDLEKVKDYVWSRYQIELEVVPLEETALDGLYTSGHVSLATYNRFLLGSLIPDDVESILYLDSDLVVVGALDELIEIGWAGAGTKDSPVVSAVSRDSPEHLTKFGHSGKDYFNAGVLLIDLVRWRSRGVEIQLFETARNLFGKLNLWDQDVLNLVLEFEWRKLPGRLNETGLVQRDQDARIVHFVGGTKPWMFGSRHPYKVDYENYRRLTPFYPYRKSGLWKYLSKTYLPKSFRNPRKKFKKVLRQSSRFLNIVRAGLANRSKGN